MAKRRKNPKQIDSLKHKGANRKNIPTAEFQSILDDDQKSPIQLTYERRNRDLDPQLVWRGKDEQDWSDLVVQAPPLFIQEKVHPKVLIDELEKISKKKEREEDDQINLFSDFNGVPEGDAKTEFYQHDANWTNRMILGDSLQVMASLAEREGLRGKVQCIYLDPPYGIKFNSNFQWSTTTRDVKDGKSEHITREPEQVKAFRDTWRDGINSYLTYLRDRLTVARDLLSESGSIFVQIGDENVHRVRSLIDEVFGEDNFVALIKFKTSSGFETNYLSELYDYILWYGSNKENLKYRQLFDEKPTGESTYYKKAQLENGLIVSGNDERVDKTSKYLINQPLVSSGKSKNLSSDVKIRGKQYSCGLNRHWKTSIEGLQKLNKADRLHLSKNTIKYRRYHSDFPVTPLNTLWDDTVNLISKNYVVQTNPKVIQRCILMTTDPGDLVLDPTCGSGTTAFVSEEWGRRWITVDTSRVSLALARSRIMGAKYPYYLLVDSKEGVEKEAQSFNIVPTNKSYFGDIRQGFVYKRAPHIMLKDIANNEEIDVIWEKYKVRIEPLRKELNKKLDEEWEEWEIPLDRDTEWGEEAKNLHSKIWDYRKARQKEIDDSIEANSEFEHLYDKPYEDKSKLRVAGPFTVESLSPHRMLSIDENDEFFWGDVKEENGVYGEKRDFTQLILENLKQAGVQQAHKEDKISFSSIVPWPGEYIAAEGIYLEGEKEKRAGILIGPEFGTVSRPDLVASAREAGDAGFDVLIACAFNFEAHATEFDKLGRIPVLKARMNADLHMADDLTGKGNLFVIFGEPDIDILEAEDDMIQVKVNGVDVFHPQTGEIRSDGADGIACWFIDTDYNEESFFVRHAYFLGANDPYKSLKNSLKAEIDKEAWKTLKRDTSRPFKKPDSGRIAVKVINHLGDEVMKVYKV